MVDEISFDFGAGKEEVQPFQIDDNSIDFGAKREV